MALHAKPECVEMLGRMGLPAGLRCQDATGIQTGEILAHSVQHGGVRRLICIVHLHLK